MTKIRAPLACTALAFALAASIGTIAPAAAYDGKPVARYHLKNAWPKAPSGGALADLPGGPKSVAPGPPDSDKVRRVMQAPGPPDSDKALGGPDTKPGGDGTRWDFTKNSDFGPGSAAPRAKGPALKAR